MRREDKNANRSSRIIKLMWITVAVPVALLFLMLALTAAGTFGRIPSFEELENPKSNLATEIYSEDGKIIGTFFVQNRSHVQYADLFPTDSTRRPTVIDGREVPPVVAALTATEDIRFRSHSGIDIPSLFRVGIKTIALQNSSQGGGSTITQQLAKNLFPRDTVRNRGKIARSAKLVCSKLKEWITALKLEYNYTKDEIAAMYLNTVEFGSNAYGIKSAAATFFNKEPRDLNIQEAAVLVGVVNAPTRYSPVRNPENAVARRNLVLARMAAAGAITQAECDSIAALPLILDYRPVSHNEGEATYFREMLRLVMNADRPVRRQFYTQWDYEQAVKEYDENPIYGWCRKNRKADGTPYDIYRDGLKIYTTINAAMQTYAEQAVQKQLATVIQPRMDAQVRNTGVLFDTDREERERIISRAMRYSDRWYRMKNDGASDKEIAESFDRPCNMKVFTFKGERDTVMTPRDSILHHKRIMRAGFVATDPRTGHVKAYVGGPNFRYFKYDMAKQGKRQIGSTIKPFIYTFAIDHLGMNPCTPVPNLPVTIETPNGTVWSPKEAGKVEYDGVLYPLQWGLARSRNNYSAWIMKQAKQPEAVADFIHNMGIRSFIDPVYALCLGSSESNVFELVSAFSTFANKGVHTDPIFVTRIEDRQGNLISSFVPQSQDAVGERTAYTMLQMLQNVVKHGTGYRMVSQFGMRDVEMGGKTGTSNENRDAWFMCVTPNLAAGAWVGAEDQQVHLRSGGEGSVLALPIVGEFMTKVYDNPRLGVSRSDLFDRPASMPVFDCNNLAPIEDSTVTESRSDDFDDEFFE
ncbi:MAG: transglycosylase domain-containing protein [Alistipes sp.]|nr:transglycosylase domain-containing protein [Alistipes sp.]